MNYTALAWAVLALAVSILVYRVFGFKYGFPEAISTRIDFIYWINIGEDWLKANVRDTTRAIAKVITYWIGEVEYFLQVRPWPLVVVALGLLGLRFGGLRLALLTVIGVVLGCCRHVGSGNVDPFALGCISGDFGGAGHPARGLVFAERPG